MKYSIIFLATLATFISCEKDEKKFLADNKNYILSVKAEADSLDADGKSMLKLTATISPNSDLRTVNFVTNSGTFLDSTKTFSTNAVKVNDSLKAIAWLVSGLEPTNYVQVKISVPQVDTIINVRFITAYAASIHVESPVASVKNGFGSEIPVQAILTRNIGSPSIHQKVSFAALRENQSSIGEFRAIDPKGITLDGVASSIFVLKDTSYTGRVKIIGSYLGKSTIKMDSLLTDTLIVFITPK
jgi:hypothetical protein